MVRRQAVMRIALVALAVPALLAACGGGVWIGYGGGDRPPQVSLAAVGSARLGEGLRLAAAASDDGIVQRVSFYRVDDHGNELLLGQDDSPPYEWVTVMPSTATGSARFFARAFDNGGQWTDSEVITVVLAPGAT